MRQSLQSKFNLLGLVLVMFFLLMLPMFSQVKADTRESLKEAKGTLMAQWMRDTRNQLKPEDLQDAEVEDYWAQEAQKHNPDCEDCNADDDRDGDGVSNGDEYRQGRNPSCNEEKYGHDYCRGQDKFNLTTDEPVKRRLEDVQLLNYTWQVPTPACQASTFPARQCPSQPFVVNQTFARLRLYLNVTQYSGVSWSLTRTTPPSSSEPATQWDRQPSCSLSCSASTQHVGTVETPPQTDYRYLIQHTATQAGVWNLRVYGVVS